MIPTFEIHRDKSIWGEDALEFKPERFEPENFTKIPHYAYIPFSSGPRMCPGYKYAKITMKIFLSQFLLKYKVSSDGKFEEFKYLMGFMPNVKNHPKIQISKRK